MSELLLCLTNVNISFGQAMDAVKNPEMAKDFESVELGDLGVSKAPVKVPRRTIYFASGETMEEYSTDEEEEDEEPVKRNVMTTTDTSKLTWGPYFWFHMWRAATSTISVCDYLGERMASLFGITSPKYQYAIDEYYRIKKEEEEEEEENRLSEEAEHKFTEQQNKENQSPATEQPEGTASFVNVTFEMEPEPNQTIAEGQRVPAPIPSS